MKNIKKATIGIIFLLVMVAQSTFAEEQTSTFLVAASSSSGTYAEGLKQIQSLCSTTDYVIKEVVEKGSGATQNLELLVNNKVSAAFLHSDVIDANAAVDSKYRQYKTLVNLYPEEIHIVVLREAKEETGGMTVAGLTLGAGKAVYTKLSDLKDLTLGAAGGGVITASRLAKQGEGGFKVVAYNSGDEVIDALKKGTIQAALFVGGSPLAKIVALEAKEFKLIPIDEVVSSKVSGLYQPAVINYTNLQSGSIKTLSSQAVILTRQYKSPKMIALQSKFRECFYKNLVELQETPGLHRKWTEVNPADHGTWEWLTLPE